MKPLSSLTLRNRYFLLTDLLLLPLAVYFSYLLRLETMGWAVYGAGFLVLAGLTCLVVPIIFRWAGICSRYWRCASVDELLLLAGSLTVAVLLAGYTFSADGRYPKRGQSGDGSSATDAMLVGLGARPILVDVAPDTLNIDPRQVEQAFQSVIHNP